MGNSAERGATLKGSPCRHQSHIVILSKQSKHFCLTCTSPRRHAGHVARLAKPLADHSALTYLTRHSGSDRFDSSTTNEALPAVCTHGAASGSMTSATPRSRKVT